MLARPEPGTKEDILLWLAGKDPNEKYDWSNCSECACGQYSSARLGASTAWLSMQKYSHAIHELNRLACDTPSRTFGELYPIVRQVWDAEQPTAAAA